MSRIVRGLTIGAMVLASAVWALPVSSVAAQAASTTASDGQSLATQSSATQGAFNAVWGTNAAAEWVREHNAALSGQPLGASPYTPVSGQPPATAAAPAAVTLSPAPGGCTPPAANATPVTVPAVPAGFTRTAVPGTNGQAISVDIMVTDQAAHRLYVADRTTDGVDVFDISTPTARFLTTWKTGTTPMGQPNGVVVAGNRVVAGLCDSTAVAIDPTSGQVVGSVSTGGQGRADELDFDSKDNKVYIANSDDGILTAIDMSNFSMVKQFTDLGPGLEQPRYDAADGMVYMTSDSGLYTFDPSDDTQVNLNTDDSVKGCRGIEINPRTNQGVMSCSSLIAYDFGSGTVLGPLDPGCPGDGMDYSPALNVFYAPNGRGCPAHTKPVMSFVGGTPIHFLTNLDMAWTSVHSGALDETNHMAYVMGQDALYGAPIPAAAQ